MQTAAGYMSMNTDEVANFRKYPGNIPRISVPDTVMTSAITISGLSRNDLSPSWGLSKKAALTGRR